MLDGSLATGGLSPTVVGESSMELMVQANAAAGRGVGVLTERPRFGLLASKLHDHDQPLRITLHATWDPEHRAARAISELVEGLAVHLTLVKAGIAAEQEWTEY